MEKRAIVAIHGVGLPELGSILQDVQSGLNDSTGPGVREDLLIEGVVYPRVSFESGPVSEIIEVNWADVKRASQDSAGLARHLVYVVNSFLHLGGEKLAEDENNLTASRIFRILFESVLVWCIYPAILMLLLASSTTPQYTVVVTVLIVGFLTTLTTILGKFSRHFLFGYIWAIVLLTLATLYWLDPTRLSMLTRYATYFYVYGQAAVVVALLVAAISIAIKGFRKHSKKYVLARLALLYLPFLAMSAIGAILWSLSLLVSISVSKSEDVNEIWKQAFLSTLNYDLRTMEYVFGGAVFAIGTLALLGVIKYLVIGKFKPMDATESNPRVEPVVANKEKNQGQLARDWISFLLHVSPVILVGVAAYFLISVSAMEGLNRGDTDILEVYTFSAMRMLPFIPFIVGPLAILLDVTGDVFFYLLPKSSSHSTQRETKRRLENAIKSIRETADVVVVLSHSQGSIVAVDVVGENSKLGARLITAGSPIATLHEEFLLSTPESRTKAFRQPSSWINLYRLDDYIGGKISKHGVENVEAGYGGHTGYWNDPNVMDAALRI